MTFDGGPFAKAGLVGRVAWLSSAGGGHRRPRRDSACASRPEPPGSGCARPQGERTVITFHPSKPPICPTGLRNNPEDSASPRQRGQLCVRTASTGAAPLPRRRASLRESQADLPSAKGSMSPIHPDRRGYANVVFVFTKLGAVRSTLMCDTLLVRRSQAAPATLSCPIHLHGGPLHSRLHPPSIPPSIDVASFL